MAIFHHPPRIPLAMDYLTVLATRSVVLFARLPANHTALSFSPKSAARSLLATRPVAMPLLALMHDDSHCAWFLVDRVLEARRPTDKELEQEAEVLVWEQIDRAKLFSRALGEWFLHADRVNEDELAGLAATHGLGLEATLREHEHSGREHTIEPERPFLHDATGILA